MIIFGWIFQLVKCGLTQAQFQMGQNAHYNPMLVFLMSCKPHDSIPWAHLLWIMYICGKKKKNVARILQEHESLKKEKKKVIWSWQRPSSGRYSRGRICCKSNWTSIRKTDVFLLHLAPRGGEELQTTARIKASDELGRQQAVNLDQSRLRLYRKTTAGEFTCNPAQTTFSWWLVHAWVCSVGSHLPKQTEPSGEDNLPFGLSQAKREMKDRDRQHRFMVPGAGGTAGQLNLKQSSFVFGLFFFTTETNHQKAEWN